MSRKRNPANILRQVPTQWAVVIVVVLIGYTLAQPAANKRFGWQLPSIAGLLGQEDARPSEAKQPRESSDEIRTQRESTPKTEGGKETSSELRYGILRKVGQDDYVSPGGLKYSRGSAEGHRLKHIERHLKDQPDRNGNHGVFYGDMTQVVRWIDDAYQRGKSGAKGTKEKKEDRRTVFEVPFDKPIGYVGGRSGARKGNPDAKHLRLVVEGNLVITAFPY